MAQHPAQDVCIPVDDRSLYSLQQGAVLPHLAGSPRRRAGILSASAQRISYQPPPILPGPAEYMRGVAEPAVQVFKFFIEVAQCGLYVRRQIMRGQCVSPFPCDFPAGRAAEGRAGRPHASPQVVPPETYPPRVKITHRSPFAEYCVHCNVWADAPAPANFGHGSNHLKTGLPVIAAVRAALLAGATDTHRYRPM